MTPNNDLEWLDTILREFRQDICNGMMSDTPKSLTFEETKAAIAAKFKEAIDAARLSEIDTAIQTTQQLWHTDSPFTNVENINANTMASTSTYLLRRKAELSASQAKGKE